MEGYAIGKSQNPLFDHLFSQRSQKPHPFGKLRAGSVAKCVTRVGHPARFLSISIKPPLPAEREKWGTRGVGTACEFIGPSARKVRGPQDDNAYLPFPPTTSYCEQAGRKLVNALLAAVMVQR